jgi:hypothetical protein
MVLAAILSAIGNSFWEISLIKVVLDFMDCYLLANLKKHFHQN